MKVSNDLCPLGLGNVLLIVWGEGLPSNQISSLCSIGFVFLEEWGKVNWAIEKEELKMEGLFANERREDKKECSAGSCYRWGRCNPVEIC